jgi:cysteine-rich repeat protein
MRAVLAALLALALTSTSAASACDGDCNGDGAVGISELILAIDIAIDGGMVERCRAADFDADGTVRIDELISAIEQALNGCQESTCGDGAATGFEECDDGNRVSGDGCGATCRLEPGGDPCAGVASSAGNVATTQLVTDGLRNPVHVTAAPLDTRRIFVVEQAGYIRVIRDGVLLPTPFLDIDARVSCCGERGLLGLAFHPDYERNGWFFVDYTDNRGDTVIARFTVSANPDRADPNSEEPLLNIRQPFANHNGGQVAFGPDGYLYVGMGDGGGGGDPQDNAQNDNTLLGKLLRIDVDVEDAPYYAVPPDNPNTERGAPLGLIWAKGLRNPWRFSFDRATRDLYIADVGQGQIEEIDFQPAGSTGGENYGWDVFEGTRCYEPEPLPQCPSPPDPYIHPVLEYNHSAGRCSVTGGYVYRGCAMPALRGEYIFADYCTPFIQGFRLVDGAPTELRTLTQMFQPGGGRSIRNVSSFGEDARGEIYIADYDGEVYKIVPRP